MQHARVCKLHKGRQSAARDTILLYLQPRTQVSGWALDGFGCLVRTVVIMS